MDTLAFVCLHGSAKSLIAAEYLNRAAAKRGVPLRATASGVEPDASIPPHVVRGLAEKGFDVSARVPRPTAIGIAGANRIIAFGCPIPVSTTALAVEQWDDCPAVSEGFEPAWQYITRRVDRLLEDLSPR